MSIREDVRNALENTRSKPIYANIDYHILMRELFPNPEDTVTGIGLKEVEERIDFVYDGFMYKYEKLPDDQKATKSKREFYEESLEEGRQMGYVELIKVLEIMYDFYNK